VKGSLALGGLLVTILYCAAAGWLMQDKLLLLPKLELNEIGDFLAGVFSPLAFLWLVLGFLQQGRELSLQAAELKNSVEQQRELVEVSRRQLEAEIAAREAEQNRIAVAAQPVLVIKQKLASSSGGKVNGQYILKNSGHQVTRLRFDWESDAAVSLPKHAPVLGTEDAMLFTIEARPNDIQSFLLKISYVDGLGAQGSATFMFSRSDTGSFPQFTPLQVFTQVVRV